MKTSRLLFILPGLAASLSILGLSGCSANFGSISNDPSQVAVHIQGLAHGGQQALSGAHIYMYAVGATGYGSASTSLLTSATGNPADGNGNFYVTTDAAGNFNIAGAFTCPGGSSSEVYLYSLGGNPQQVVGGVASTDNPGAGLLATLGTCAGINSVQFVTMNENSTIATAFALAPYATDATHIGSSATTLGVQGILNAGINALNMVDQASGLPHATLSANANATVPVTTINTLADILASCINTSGGSSCTPLFSHTLNGGTTGTTPTDTATAAINIAHNPAVNVSSLLSLATSTGPFQPTLSSVNDFTLGITFTGGGLNSPGNPAIDAAGNAWIPNTVGTSVTEISSSGAFLSGSGYTGGGISWPGGIAFDRSGQAWVENFLTKSVTRLDSSGAVIHEYTGGGMANGPNYIAIGATGNVWVVTGNANGLPAQGTVSILSPLLGSFLSGTSGYTAGGLDASNFIAIDGAGNGWVTNTLGNITKVTPAGAFPFGASGVSDPTLSNPSGVALDGTGNAWVISSGSISKKPASVLKVANNGTILVTGLQVGNVPQNIAIDGGGSAWVTDGDSGSVRVLSNAGTILSGSTGYQGSGIPDAYGIGIDGSGDVWVTSITNNSVIELIGAAQPVITPFAAALPTTTTANGSSNLGTRP
ncbi:MAG TPA: NHL repeat-containing protein [Granulicella sp.]|jgi:streptogramin lyase